MANLSPGKREVKRMAALLDGDFGTVEEAAEAALNLAWEMFEGAGKWTVVGQIYWTPEGGWLSHEDAAADKVALGYYRTENQAHKAAESLTTSSSTHEEARAWVIKTHHGSPSSWYMTRKKAREEASKKQAPSLGKAS